ncbi:hypothetical protein KSS87_008629, partial [Heliosperma pusillum]
FFIASFLSSHLQGMFLRTIRLLEAGIKPVYVFDGEPPGLKKEQLARRYSKRADATEDLSAAIERGDKEGIEKFSKRTVKVWLSLQVTRQHNMDCMKLLGLMGIPVVEAPSEAEAQCAALCKNGKVYAVASEDMDTLTFGATRFLRHLMDPPSKKIPVMEFEMAKVLEELNLTMDQFIDLCILSGCDYCANIKGIGGLTALKLIRQHGSIETILENLNKGRYERLLYSRAYNELIIVRFSLVMFLGYPCFTIQQRNIDASKELLPLRQCKLWEGPRYQVAGDWPYQEVRRLFKEPLVFPENEEPELKWNPPDEEGLVNFLVKENSFNIERVAKAIEKINSAKIKTSQGRVEPFFKPVATDSVPIKRKGSKCILGSSNQGNRTRIHLANAYYHPRTGTSTPFRLQAVSLSSKNIASSFQVLHFGA